MTSKTGSPVTWENVIAIAQELPGVEVGTSYNTPGLKVKGRAFARLRTEAEGGLVLMCSLEEKDRLLDLGDPAYFTTPHYDGYGAILVDLAHVTREALRPMIAESYRIISTPKKKRTGTRVCHHCKQEIPVGALHHCWLTTEKELTKGLSEDLQDAWERLRETAAEFGDQRIYASHHCIMFSRKICYFFVRPKKTHLELTVFVGRAIKAPQIRRVTEQSKTRRANILRIVHRDEVESPITDWLREAYELADPNVAKPKPKAGTSAKRPKVGAKATTKSRASR